MNYKQLKSGSDVRGTALNGKSEVNLTDKAVSDITDAYIVFLSKKLNKTDLKIAVGHDSRLSAQRIASAIYQSLQSSGCVIYPCNLCSTPSMFMMTQYKSTDCDGSIMVTASHHPYDKNGLKFFTKDGGLSGGDISEIITLAESGEKVIYNGEKVSCSGENNNIQPDNLIKSGAKFVEGDFLQLYCDGLIEKINKETGSKLPLAGFKIAVDAGNGAGGFYAERVLKVLGADISGSQFLQPDGRFPNHIPNPEDKAAMQSIANRVKLTGSDLGIIFDTDVDRAAIVSSDGEEINRNKLIALISGILLEENKGAVIVTDSVTSDGLNKYILARGGEHCRFKRGYKNVIDEAIRQNAAGKNAVIAIETSGHAAFKENFFLDDGAYLVTRLIIKMAQLKNEGKSLQDLFTDLECPAEESEVRISFNEGVSDWKGYGNSVLQSLEEFLATDENFKINESNYEGVRANLLSARGWFLVRMSVHDPNMAINIESEVSGGVKVIAQFLYGFLNKFSQLDISGFIKLLN